MRKRILVGIALLPIVFLSGCGLLFTLTAASDNDAESQERIVAYVNENHEILEAIPYDEMPQLLLSDDGYHYEAYSDNEGRSLDQAERDFINEYLGYDTIVLSIDVSDENIVDFQCGGTGIATNSTYVGFYYSRDDTPFAVVFEGERLTETSTGVFEWQNENGSHAILTVKIRDNWYYYWVKYY